MKPPPNAPGRSFPRAQDALRGSALHLAQWLDERSHANGDSPSLADLVHSLGARRNHHPYRLTIVTKSMTELVQELDGFGVKQESPKVAPPSLRAARRLAHRFRDERTGPAMVWHGPRADAPRAGLPRDPRTLRHRDETVGALLLEELARTEETSQMQRTEIAQPAIFALQVSLAELWKSWGIDPAAIVGHSVGEIAAACVAGVLSLEEAARISAGRAAWMARARRRHHARPGSWRRKRAAIARDRTVTIAAINGPRSLTLAGARISLEAMLAEMEPQGVFARLVRVDHPFHHPLMQPASEELEKALADLGAAGRHDSIFSTVTGGRCPAKRAAPSTGTRRAAARAVCVGGQCAGGIRRGRVA